MPPQSKIGLRRAMANQYDRTFKRGSLIFIEGETSTEMYIVRSGKIRLLKQEGENPVELAILGPGSVLGELSLLDRQPRSATAQVIEDTVVTVIDEALFQHTISTIPSWLSTLVQVVVKRLRDTMKKTSDDLIQKNVAGVIRILLLLAAPSPNASNENEQIVPLSLAKEKIYSIIGLGNMEAESVFLHLILKGMLLIQKNSSDQEQIIIKDHLVLQTYMNYLRAQQRGVPIPGENLSAAALSLTSTITAVGEKLGKPIAGKGAIRLTKLQLERELASREKENKVPLLSLLDELGQAKIIIPAMEGEENKLETWDAFLFNPENIKRMQILHTWLPIFREEVQL